MPPITFVDYLIIGSGVEGQHLAKRLLKTKRGVLLLRESELGSASEEPSHEEGTFSSVIAECVKVDRADLPRGTFQVSVGTRSVYRCRYLIMAPRTTLDFSIYGEKLLPTRHTETGWPVLNGELESVNIRHLYFLTKQNGAAGNGGGDARFLHRVLEFRNHRTPFPCKVLPLVPEVLARAVLQRMLQERVSHCVEGAHGDLIFPDYGAVNANYYEDIPLDTLPDGGFAGRVYFFTISLQGKRNNAGHRAIPDACPRLVVVHHGTCREELVLGGHRFWNWDSLRLALRSFFIANLPSE